MMANGDIEEATIYIEYIYGNGLKGLRVVFVCENYHVEVLHHRRWPRRSYVDFYANLMQTHAIAKLSCISTIQVCVFRDESER